MLAHAKGIKMVQVKLCLPPVRSHGIELGLDLAGAAMWKSLTFHALTATCNPSPLKLASTSTGESTAVYVGWNPVVWTSCAKVKDVEEPSPIPQALQHTGGLARRSLHLQLMTTLAVRGVQEERV